MGCLQKLRNQDNLFHQLRLALGQTPLFHISTLTDFVQYVFVADDVVSLIGALYLYFRVRDVGEEEDDEAEAAPDPSQEEPRPGTAQWEIKEGDPLRQWVAFF